MPSPPVPTPAAALSRRVALAGLLAAAAAGVAGCTGGEDRPGRRRRGRRSGDGRRAAARPDDRSEDRDPDIALAEEALAGEQALLDAVTRTSARHHDLAELLRPVADAHRAHVELLAEAAPDHSPDPSPVPSPAAAPGAEQFHVPARSALALRRLSRMEDDLATSGKQHAFAAQSGAFARLLASMAASAAQHTVVLRDAGGREESR